MSPDGVYQVRIEHRSRALGDGFLVDPGFVVTTAEAVRDTGPVVELRTPGEDGAEGPGTPAGPAVAAEVVEVLGEDGLALLAVADPGLLARPVPPGAALERPGHEPVPADAVGDWLRRFRRLSAEGLRAALDGPGPHGDPATEAGAGPVPRADERGALLLDYLREQARSGRLDAVVTVPALGAPEGSR